MHKVLMNQKGFKVDFRQRKEMTPLQRKCLDIVTATQKLIEDAVKNEEAKTIESTLFQLVALQTMLPAALKANNEDVINMQLKALKDYVIKVDFEEIPKCLLKSFLSYRKTIIGRI